jgi:signal transduction histidine kinase/CheY-like chemotaxis protein
LAQGAQSERGWPALRSAPLAPVAVALMLALVTTVLWRALGTHDDAQVKSTVNAATTVLALEVQRALRSRVFGLERMGVRWETRGGTPEDEWATDAAHLVSHEAGFASLAWVDPSGAPRWVQPAAAREGGVAVDLAREAARTDMIELARSDRRPLLSRAIRLADGRSGFVVYVPLFPKGQFDGVILAICRFDELLRALTPPTLAARYDVAAWDGEVQVAGPPLTLGELWSDAVPVRLTNVWWDLRLSPRPGVLSDLASPLPDLVLGLGLTMALLVGIAFHLMVLARARTQDALLAGAELQAAMTQRRAAEAKLQLLAETLEARIAERTRALDASRADAVRLERELFEAQKLEALGRLAGGVAHDFNNSLMAISGLTELALMRISDDHSARRLVAQVQQAADKAASLTRQILAFGRRQVLQPEVVDLAALIENSHEMLERLLGPGVSLTIVRSSRPSWVEIDPGQMHQVILNLTLNARDAMPEGGNLVMEFRHIPPDSPAGGLGFVALDVRDNGCGMDEHTLAHVFEPFFTTKASGHGLGLAMVHGMISQSGGQIVADSQVGAGTTVTIRLAAVAPPPAVAGLESGRYPAVFTDPRGTVLFAEDDDLVREVIVGMLEDGGYRVLRAADGAEGLRLCQEHDGPIDVLLTDVLMPRVAGPELAQGVARLRPGTPVVYLSGYTASRLGEDGILQPDVAFLQKPVSQDDLMDALAKAIATAAKPSRRRSEA